MTREECLAKWNDHIDHLIDIIKSIEPGKVTILTGGNGKGKSLIRKQLWQNFQDRINDGRPVNKYVSDVSMQRRTGLHSELGGMGVFLRDQPEDPTSVTTYHFIDGIINRRMMDDKWKRYIVIDESEIGMSEEFQVSIARFLNDHKEKILNDNLGMMVITHSKTIVRELDSDAFVNIEGLTKEQWLMRRIEPLDIQKAADEAHELFLAILERTKKVDEE